jgi:hypothetical protein
MPASHTWIVHACRLHLVNGEAHVAGAAMLAYDIHNLIRPGAETLGEAGAGGEVEPRDGGPHLIDGFESTGHVLRPAVLEIDAVSIGA